MSGSDLKNSKLCVVRLVQSSLHSLLNSSQMLQNSPVVEEFGVIRVGGRLSQMSGSVHFKNPIILPKNSLFSTLVV